MTVADRIKEQRLKLELSQSELAKRAGYSDKTAISKLEHAGNSITLKQIERISTALNVNPYFLMGWTDSPDPVNIFTIAEEYNANNQQPPEPEEVKKFEVTETEYQMIQKYKTMSSELKKVVDNIIDNAFKEKQEKEQIEIRKTQELLGFGGFL